MPSGSPTARPALRNSATRQPDVCVLDLMLPRIDGWRVIEQARGEDRHADRRRQRPRHRARPHQRARARGGRPRQAVLDERACGACRCGGPPRHARAEPRRGDEIEVEAPARPAQRPGLCRRRERRADTDRVPAALRARARPEPCADARRAAPARLGPPRLAPRPHRRRLRPQAAGRRSTHARRGTFIRRATGSATSSTRRRSSLQLPA